MAGRTQGGASTRRVWGVARGGLEVSVITTGKRRQRVRGMVGAAGIAAIAAALLLAGCGKDDDDPAGPGGGGGGGTTTYEATATITYWETKGALDGAIDRPLTLTRAAHIEVGPALVVGQQTESNPFNLTMWTPGEVATDGYFFLDSAQEIVVGTPPAILLQYWTFSNDGGTLSGTLTDTHQAEACAVNMMSCYSCLGIGDCDYWPFFMYGGCTLSGTLSGGSIDLTIAGEARWSYTHFGFQIQIHGNKAGGGTATTG